MTIMRFNIQGEDIFEFTNGKRHAFAILICKGKIFELTNASVICVHFSQVVDHCVI